MAKLTPECCSVANYIIAEINKYNEDKLFSEQILLNVKKLQKLLYFCDIEYMKQYDGTPMFQDDFHAWPSGPVITEVYLQFAVFQDGKMYHQYGVNNFSITEEMKSVINSVIEATKEMDTIDLVKISQIENGPWSNVYNADDPNHGQIISKKEMFEFYSNIELFSNIENHKKQKFDVLAVPFNKPFVVASEKVEEFKNSTNSKKDNEQVRKMAETFRKNNLVDEGPVKKIGQKK